MSLALDARTFAELLGDPAAGDVLSASTGSPLVLVELASAADGQALAGLDITAVPAVVTVIAPDPGWLPPGARDTADIILTEDEAAGAPYAVSDGGIAKDADAIAATLAANPVAGVTLVLLLRTSARLDVAAGIVAESAAYSALQEGAEFLRWRASRPARTGQPAQADRPTRPAEHDAETARDTETEHEAGGEHRVGGEQHTGGEHLAGGDRQKNDAERVRVERSDDAIRITLARPARRNAVDVRMRDALAAALAEAAADGIRPVVLRGDGPSFCAGGDLDEFGARPDPAAAHLIRLTRSLPLLMHRVGGRTTAELHGACVGAGIELPAFAARVVAAPDTRIGLPETGLGLLPGSGGTVSIPRRIGRWRTAFLALSGGTIGADQALRWGLADAIAQ